MARPAQNNPFNTLTSMMKCKVIKLISITMRPHCGMERRMEKVKEKVEMVRLNSSRP
jgi:hypothetical protein